MDGLPCLVMVPAAGASVRYQQRTMLPKGLVIFRYGGQYATMVDHVVPHGLRENVVIGVPEDHAKAFAQRLPKHWDILPLGPTSGQAETVWRMAAAKHLSELDVLVINCDNAFSSGTLEYFLSYCRVREAVCGALVFKPSKNLDRYGYVNDHPNFAYGVEKNPISKYALAGAFYFQSSAIMVRYGNLSSKYLSEWFMEMPKPKVSLVIYEDELFEWGTADDLISSVGSENIIWEP